MIWGPTILSRGGVEMNRRKSKALRRLAASVCYSYSGPRLEGGTLRYPKDSFRAVYRALKKAVGRDQYRAVKR